MIRRPPRSTLSSSSAASDVYKRQIKDAGAGSWAAQVAADGGPAIPTYNLGSRNRTLAQDVQIVQYLPKGSLVFVGINIGRFTEPKSSPTVTPAGTATLD